MRLIRFSKMAAVLLSVVLLLACVPTVAAAGTPTIAVSSVSGAAGSSVDVTINLKNNPGIASALLTVTYPAEVTLTAVTDAGQLGAKMHKPQLTSPYMLCWANDTATTNFTANGTVATLTFAIPASAKSGTSYPITVSYDYENYEIMDVDSNPIEFTVQNGSIRVAAPTTKAPTTTTAAPTTKAPTVATKAPTTTTKAPTAAPTAAPTKAPTKAPVVTTARPTVTVAAPVTTVADVTTLPTETTETTLIETTTTTPETTAAAIVTTTTAAMSVGGDPAPANNTVWWILLGVVVLLLVAAVIWLVVKRRK